MDQNLTPKNFMPSHKNFLRATQPGYAGTITNLQIVLNPQKIPT